MLSSEAKTCGISGLDELSRREANPLLPKKHVTTFNVIGEIDAQLDRRMQPYRRITSIGRGAGDTVLERSTGLLATLSNTKDKRQVTQGNLPHTVPH